MSFNIDVEKALALWKTQEGFAADPDINDGTWQWKLTDDAFNYETEDSSALLFTVGQVPLARCTENGDYYKESTFKNDDPLKKISYTLELVKPTHPALGKVFSDSTHHIGKAIKSFSDSFYSGTPVASVLKRTPAGMQMHFKKKMFYPRVLPFSPTSHISLMFLTGHKGRQHYLLRRRAPQIARFFC